MIKTKSADSFQAKCLAGNARRAIQQLFAAVFCTEFGQRCACLHVLMLNYSLNVFRAVPVERNI